MRIDRNAGYFFVEHTWVQLWNAPKYKYLYKSLNNLKR